MRPERIRLLDRWLGGPLCCLLTACWRVRRWVAPPSDAPPRRILFVKLIEMGSTVLACPAFREAERMVGRDNLFFLAFAPNRPIVDVLPFFKPENVLALDDSNLLAFARDLLRAIVRVRRERIDAAVDMEGLTRSSSAIAYLTGCRIRVGYHNFTSEGPYRGRLFTRELNYTFQQHVSRSFLALVRALAAPADQTPMLKEAIRDEDLVLPPFEPTAAERAEAVTLTCPPGRATDPGPVILLNPNCSDLLPLRRWPTERFVELGRCLLERYPGAVVAITGAPAERAEAERIAARIGPQDRAVCLAGRTTLRGLLALYSVSDLLVTNDSGPCHFAALTPIRLVALYGPETPMLYGPMGRRATAITAGLACSPCVNMLNHRFSPCRDNRCMAAISVERVFEAAVAALTAGGRVA